MTTPTPMRHGLSQQGRTPSQNAAAPTPPVSSPFSASQAHAAFSPLGPRSSPQQARNMKSPANSSTLMGHGGSAPVSFDSPSAAAALGALGITGGLDIGLDAVGVGGLGLSGLARLDDDERLKRMHNLLDELKVCLEYWPLRPRVSFARADMSGGQSSRGIVSEAGLERLAKTAGLECIWEEGMGMDKSRTLIIAGSALALDIVLSNNIVQKVSLSFPESSELVMKHVDKAGQVLLDDLKLQPRQSPLLRGLDRFAANLERLAVLDKLSVVPALNLHEAIAGIFESLDKLFRWDVQKLREDPAMAGRSDDFLQRTALCTRHGCPVMHVRDRLGLSLEYWKETRLAVPSEARTKSLGEATENTWAILIGCAPMGGLVYQPVRVSEKWLSDEVEKLHPTDDELLSGTAGPILDWLDPENTILPASEDSKPAGGADAIATDPALSGSKLPEAMFTATFDPPVTVPLAVYVQFCNLIGLPHEAEMKLETFDSLKIPVSTNGNHDPSEPRMVCCRDDVSFDGRDGDLPPEHARNTLFVYKPVWGRTLEQLPFSHPSQLVRMLPSLRQYAFLSTLLDKSFNAKLTDVIDARQREPEDAQITIRNQYRMYTEGEPASQGPAKNTTGAEPRPSPEATSSMDVTLTAHPVPRLQVVFPFRDGAADIMLEIREDGLVHVVSQNIIDEAGADSDMAGRDNGRQFRPQDLGRVLEVCENLGKWCRWIRNRFG